MASIRSSAGSQVTGLTSGTHQINFLQAYGYTTPPGQIVNVVPGQTTYTSGTYISVIPSDSVQVNLIPANIDGAWTVDAGPLEASGATVSVGDGVHTISFLDVSGFTTPPSQTISTSSNAAVATTGTYAAITEFGSITVAIIPAASGGKWNVDGGTAQKSGATVSNLPIGSHSINFAQVTGYSSPASQTVQVQNNVLTSATGIYTALASSTGSISVSIAPSAAVKAGAKWNLDGGAEQSSGATLKGISGGTHTVNFSITSGFTTPAPQTVAILPNETISATGIYARHSPASPAPPSPSWASPRMASRS